MPLNFPGSPSNGQSYSENGITYTYDSTYGVWKVSPIAVDFEEIKQINKLEAKRLLINSDWVEYPSVTDQTKNPHLTNLNEWIDYRVALRAIAVNPPEQIISEWPVSPVSQWG
jgi:hypothetical protein